MEEEVGVKAPVTRLRRRLSVESDDVKSPSGSLTPTKKRGSRLVTKPQLDLIVEATENIPKRSTRKTAAKDISIDPGDEIPVTPSRRSARIRSNTSIVSETTQNFDSPRAKRAARRTSQAGSDNETPLTPARQTRRTRKDSTSSIDKQDDAAIVNKTVQIAEVIVEETEASDDHVKNITTVRKSPRLSQKKDKTTISTTLEDISNDHDIKNDNDASKTSNEIRQSMEPAMILSPMNVDMQNDMITEIKNIHQDNLSSDNSSDKLIIDLDRKPKKINSIINKSTSALEDPNSSKSKRQRTKSWSTISVTTSKDDKFHSDNEVTNKKRKKKSLGLFDMGSGDGVYNSNPAIGQNKANKIDKENENNLNLSNNTNTSNPDESLNKSIKPNKSSTEVSKTVSMSEENTEETNQRSQNSHESNSVTKLLEMAPSKNIQSLILIEDDSDSNAGSVGNIKQAKQYDGEDQCVPVVKQHIQIEEKDQVHSNNSYEPMDVDETIPQNISITDYSENKTTNKLDEHVPKQNASICIPTENVNLSVTSNKSKRKSLSSYSESQNLETSNNENKSTLIVSQIKDTSSNEFNTMLKSPKVTNIDKQHSQTSKISDIAQDKEKNYKNASSTYLTSTPLQQKANKKIGMQIDTSIISPKNVNIKETKDNNSIRSNKKENSPYKLNSCDDKKLNELVKEKKQINDEQETDSSADETSKEQSNLIDDEAEEGSADYESGDSQDSEERQYEKDNEILDKGESLNTDDEYSDDTDYEKDSFIVSSDEEDQELLSGSGDDLSMSDNELSMTAKSKKKFDDRKIKEQKKASREMYQARHKINDSDRSSKSDKPITKKNKRQRLDSSSNSEEEIAEQPKKNNRRRIDSSQDISLPKSEADESVNKKKKKSKRLSESLSNDNVMNEIEMTILHDNDDSNINPLAQLVKQEPKTPQKDLNISTVLITDNVEEVKIDENVSIVKSNETSDPLQATMIANDESDSSSSGNEEIIENYESMLNELNNKPIKTKDISLNLNKKEKTAKEPIFDQLNLSNTKKLQKKNKNNTVIDTSAIGMTEDVQALKKRTITSDDDAASDSIDMRLLFPEDSNESDVIDKNQNQGNTANPLSDFIPLKKTEAQTNIRASMDTTSGNNDKSVQNLSNSSKKKNKKRESSQNSPPEITSTNEQEDSNSINFFIDTAGTQLDASINTTLKNSAKKKNKNNSVVIDDVAEDTPVEILYSSGKKKTKSKISLDNTKSEAVIFAGETPLENTVITSEKKNKKNKKGGKSLNNSHKELEIEVIATDEDDSNVKFIIDTVGTQIDLDASVDTSLTNSAKKKKTKVYNIDEEIPVDILYSSEKKNKKTKLSLDNTQNDAVIDIDILDKIRPVEPEPENTEPTSGKKKKRNKKGKLSLNNTYNEMEVRTEDVESDEAPLEISYNSDKKKKKAKLITDNNDPQIIIETQTSSTVSEEAPLEVSYRSDKNKQKKKSLSQDTLPTEIALTIQNTSLDSAKKKKRKSNPNVSADINDLQIKEVNTVPELEQVDMNMNTKKRKRKTSLKEVVPTDDHVNISKSSESMNELLTVGNQKKKRKISDDIGEIPGQDSSNVNYHITQRTEQNRKKKTNKQGHNEENRELIVQVPLNKNRNKRKEREDDDSVKMAKVSKENSLDKIHVPRLPSHILNQLDDKPKQVIVEKKKHQAISTANFSVEDTKIRRNKPSNYLEESVYLNDSPVVKKQKKSLKKPKVLPFMPTASTSDSGFTTNFRINLLPRETHYISQSNDAINFKNDFLQQHKHKRFDTLGKYKTKNKNRDKIDKF